MLWTGYTGVYAAQGEQERVHLKISHPTWNHVVGNTGVTDQIRVGNYSWNGTVYNPSNQAVDMNFALDDNFVPVLGSNSYLVIHYSSNVDQQFPIAGFAQAWQTMVQCKANYGMH
jgi:hypothetical protein